jgi:hypothetical protein
LSCSAFQLSRDPKQRRRHNSPHDIRLSAAKMHSKNSLDSWIDTSLQEEKEIVLLVDSNNVRGKEDFQLTNSGLLKKLQWWHRQSFSDIESRTRMNIVCVVDHGSKAGAFSYEGLGLVVFAGPNRTADDVIAQATRWMAPSPEEFNSVDREGVEKTNDKRNVFVVTSDGELRMRCLRSNRPGNMKRKKRPTNNVKVFGSPQLLPFLEKSDDSLQDPNIDREEAGNDQRTAKRQLLLESKLLEVEKDIREYERKRPPYKNREEQLEALASGVWKSSILLGEGDDASHDEEEFTSPSLPFDTKSFSEKTWHRVLIAENMRRMMEQLPSAPSSPTTLSPVLSGYQTFYNQKNDFSSVAATANMFEDHRIQHEPYLQQQLLQYLDQGVASTTSKGDKKAEDPSPSKEIADPVDFFSPAHSSAEFLRSIVQESPEKIQDQILLRYMKEAPIHLQFSRKEDLRDLLLFVAVREKREEDKRPHWYLKTTPTTMEDWYIQPGGGRRRAKRCGNQNRSKKVDEAMVAVGRVAEERWFERLKWPKQFKACCDTAK